MTSDGQRGCRIGTSTSAALLERSEAREEAKVAQTRDQWAKVFSLMLPADEI